MKRGALRRAKRLFGALTLVTGVLTSIPIQSAEATNDVSAACVIGSDSACPAQSPQEIYNLYGTTSDGTYYLNVGGVSTQVYLLMNRTGSDNGGWVLLMKGVKGSSNFGYSATAFTSNTTTFGTTSLTNDVSTDAKFSAYNSLSIKKILAAFKDPTYGTYSNNGDIANNAFGGHVWMETLSTPATAFSTLDTAINIATGTYTNVRYSLYRESNSSSATQVFAYENGVAYYGFKQGSCSGKDVRWGLAFNNESDFSSCDTYVGIGLGSHAPGDQVTWTGTGAFQNPSGTGKGSSGFQLWGKIDDPSLNTPGALSLTNLGSGSVRVNFGAASGATEYAVQYKTAGSNWNTGTTVRLTNPGASPSATLSGLTTGSYDFRVFSRATNNSSAGNSYLLAQTVDATAPTVSSIAITSSPGADSIYGAGEVITATVSWSETVTVTGTPRIQIQGLSSKYLTYASGSGTPTTTFTYTVVSGDMDRDGFSISLNSLAQYSGSTITDLSLNTAILSHSAITASLSLQVDGTPPSAPTLQTSSNGSSITLTYSETLSALGPTLNNYAVLVNGVADAVISQTFSGATVTINLTFSIISGATVTLAYSDPSSANDVNAIQDEAGNDAIAFTATSVTNISTATSNTTATIALNPVSLTAEYRTLTYIRVTTNTSGKVDFYLAGKIIAGCRNISTSANVATCSWKPAIHNYVDVMARFKPTGSGFMNTSTSTLRIFVLKRSGTR